MRYYKPISFALMFLILAILAVCMAASLPDCATFQNLIGQPQLETYTFNHGGHEYSALLPGEVPLPPEFAVMKPVCWYRMGPLCAMYVVYSEDKDVPQAVFWFLTDGRGIVGLVYFFEIDAKQQRICYIYLKGLPIKIPDKEMQAKLDEWVSPPKQ